MSVRKLRVFLIVEAGETALSTRKLVVESVGFNCLSAVATRQAYELLERHSADLLIFDTSVTDVPLREAITELKRRLNGVPCYLLSSRPWAPDDAKDLVDGVFEKMRDPLEMIHELESRFPER